MTSAATLETDGHGGRTLEEEAAACRYGMPDRVKATDPDDSSDRGCAICRGEVCIACGGDAYDCEHDTDAQHGWDQGAAGCTTLAWTPWLAKAREAAKFWGLRRVATDLYREQFAMGLEPEKAVKQIMQKIEKGEGR